MGVEEYRLLTRTMKTITTRSNKLVKTRDRLKIEEDNEPEIKKLRKRVRRLRAKEKTEIDRIKKAIYPVKEDAARVEKRLKQISKAKEEVDPTLLKRLEQTPTQEIRKLEKELRTTPPSAIQNPSWRRFSQNRFRSARRREIRKRLRVLKRIEKKPHISTNAGDQERSMLESQRRTIGMELHNLEFALNKLSFNSECISLERRIKELGSRKHSRDSATKKEIKLLEEEISQLWDSIAHLIPYSSALEKA